MKEDCPSDTALRVALRRAAHQVLDNPRVFEDPLALRILGANDLSELQSHPQWPGESPLTRALRASLAARSRYCEDELHRSIRRGVCQYVVLGAGLDTFGYRNPYGEEVLRVIEVDHGATQGWKRGRIEEEGIRVPETLTFIPIDFETETLSEGLQRAGFDRTEPTFFSWLGVTMYLTNRAITGSLEFVASMPSGSGIVFDYMIPRSLMSPTGL
jgi:methyltransferase (TIGR00027 family)